MRMKSRFSLPWVAAAILAFALPATQSAWALANASTTRLLDSQLPPGVSLKRASIDQTGEALYASTSQRPDLALSLLEVAVIAKRPPPHHGNLPCADLIKLLRRSVAAAPDQARPLLELAISLDPECTDALNDLLQDPAFAAAEAAASGSGFGFGLGLSSDFPGSPGFTGSPPGGTVALPPVSAPPVLTADT